MLVTYATCYTISTASFIDTLSLHDALPISGAPDRAHNQAGGIARHQRGASVESPAARKREEAGRGEESRDRHGQPGGRDRKSTRLNSSHLVISYAVFSL